MAFRLDENSDRPLRTQYRFRFRPAYTINDAWSLHGFVATGEEFESAYNTVDDNDDQLHLRRLFGRYEVERGKLEFGIIPPFKGRVSSTGLSKEGWITGARGVLKTSGGAIELVVGDLDDLRAKNAIGKDFDFNYAEVEYSSDIDDQWSFELGAERMFDSSFGRVELRYNLDDESAITGELIHNFGSASSKLVVSTGRDFVVRNRPLEWFAFYTFTDADFGRRADLAEDFLEFGHALAAKVEGGFAADPRVGWFAELEVYESRSRLKLGVEIALH